MPESNENTGITEGNTEGNTEELEQTPAPVDDEPEGDTFPRSYVEKLRKESADYRTRAQKADTLAAELWSARVAATGRLADPSDLPMPQDAEPSAEAVTEAIDSLLESKPHMAARVPRGDVGQGERETAQPFSLLGALNTHAR